MPDPADNLTTCSRLALPDKGIEDTENVRRYVGPYTHREYNSSAIDETSQHMTDVILSTEKHRQNPYDFRFFIDVKPIDRSIDRQMPQSRQNIVVTFASAGRSQNAISRGTNLQNPCFGLFDRNLYTLAKIDVAFEEMVENQPKIAFGLGRKLKTKRHGRGACRQASSSAARPFLSPRQTRRPGARRGPHKAPCAPGLRHPNAAAIDEWPAEQPR